MTRGNGVDDKTRTGIYIAADKNIRLRRLIRLGISHGTLTATKLHRLALKQISPLDGLADGKHHVIGFNKDGVGLVIAWREALVFVKHLRAALKCNATDTTVFRGFYCGRSPAVIDDNAVFLSLRNLFGKRRHLIGLLKTIHGHRIGSAAHRHTSCVNGNVAAADDNGLSGNLMRGIIQSRP